MKAAGSFSTYPTNTKGVLFECGRFNLADSQTPTHQDVCSHAWGQGKKKGRTGMRKTIGQV